MTAGIDRMALSLDRARADVEALAGQLEAGRTGALARLRRVHPAMATGGAPGHEGARLVVARESGFADWDKLRASLDPDAIGAADAERAIVEAALAGNASLASALAGRWPEVVRASLPCAVALVREDAADHLTGETANREVGPMGWPPLVYLCFSRTGAGDAATDSQRVALAARLLSLGADPSAGARESETVRGYRTALGGAVGQARSPALVAALLDAGADIADGPTLYEGSAMWEAVRHRDMASIALLLDAGPPQWHVCHALPHGLRYNDLAMTELLLAHNGDPNWTMGAFCFDGNCLHEAVMLDCGVDVATALLDAGAHVDFRDRDGRTALEVAVCLNRSGLAELLERRGADRGALRPVDQFMSACFAGREVEAGRIRRIHPDLAAAFLPSDRAWLVRAVHAGNDDAVRLLLDAGVDPDVRDDDGDRPLHAAAMAGNDAVARLLLDAGAEPAARNYAGLTPLDLAVGLPDETVRDQLTVLLAHDAVDADYPGNDDPVFAAVFERAADAVVAGDAATLRALLAEHPVLATARSSRAHRCTLLNYLGANGVEHERQQSTPANAVEMIDILLAAGSDPNAASYCYRGGPGANTIALLTSSSHPQEAGLTIPMVAALARAGAEVDPDFDVLCRLDAADREGRLAATARELADSAGAEGALVQAAGSGDLRLLAALLDAGVDIHAAPSAGVTAMHQAAFNGCEAAVDVLLERGADPRLRDQTFNGNAAGWANAGEHEELSKRLAEVIEGMG